MLSCSPGPPPGRTLGMDTRDSPGPSDWVHAVLGVPRHTYDKKGTRKDHFR